jgi:hypothetical protein
MNPKPGGFLRDHKTASDINQRNRIMVQELA